MSANAWIRRRGKARHRRAVARSLAAGAPVWDSGVWFAAHGLNAMVSTSEREAARWLRMERYNERHGSHHRLMDGKTLL